MKNAFWQNGDFKQRTQDIMCYRTEQKQHRNFNVAFGTQTNGNEEPGFWLVVCLPRSKLLPLSKRLTKPAGYYLE